MNMKKIDHSLEQTVSSINFHFFLSLNFESECIMSMLFIEPFVFVGAVMCFKMHGKENRFF